MTVYELKKARMGSIYTRLSNELDENLEGDDTVMIIKELRMRY